MRFGARLVGVTLLALALARCGGGDICLNCESGPTPTPGPVNVITIQGSINSNNFDFDISMIRVIACFDLDPALVAPSDFNDCPAKTQVFPDSNRNFTITNNLATIDQEEASIRLGFWFPTHDPVVLIEDGDFFAELTELAEQVEKLEDVSLGRTAQINPIDITFEMAPDSGTATTARIDVFVTPNTTPTPDPNATPSP